MAFREVTGQPANRLMKQFFVSSSYPDDVAMQQVGEQGEVLFMRGLAYAALADTDGFIPETQLPRFGLPKIAVRVTRLVLAGLWDEVDGGYQVRNWWNWQSEAYAQERQRLKEANRKRTKRAQEKGDVRPLVRGLSADCPRTGGGPEDKRTTTTPLPPAEQGECSGQHVNCRGCGTTRRQQVAAAGKAKPAWCGSCDEGTRLRGRDSDFPARCPACHPLAQDIA